MRIRPQILTRIVSNGPHCRPSEAIRTPALHQPCKARARTSSNPPGNSRNATSPTAARHSIAGGIGLNDPSSDAYPGYTAADLPRKQSEGLVKVDIASPHHPLRFSLPNKLMQLPPKPRLDPTTEKALEEDEEESDSSEKVSNNK